MGRDDVPEHPPRPVRVTVTSPRTSAVRRPRGPQVLRAVDEQDVVGDLLLRSLVRAQLLLALRLGGAFLLVLGGLPLLFAVTPAVRDVEVLGLALPWLVLGVLVYPVLWSGGWLYVRLAERHERDFVDLVQG